MMAAAVRVAVAEVAVVRDNPPLASVPTVPARSRLGLPPRRGLPPRDMIAAAVHAVPPIVAVNPTVASPRLAAHPIADHPPSTATLVLPSEHRHHRNLSPKAVAANVAA